MSFSPRDCNAINTSSLIAVSGSLLITTVFIIAQDIIPSMRRRIPVINTKHIIKTPLATAVSNLDVKTKQLIKLYQTCQNDGNHNTNSLSMSVLKLFWKLN